MNTPPPIPPVVGRDLTITYDLTRTDLFINSLGLVWRIMD